MPWDDSAQAGFTDSPPWLPIPAEHRARSVATQDADPGSVLNATRRFLRWRQSLPALLGGDIRFLDAPEPVPAFPRRGGDQKREERRVGKAEVITWNVRGC